MPGTHTSVPIMFYRKFPAFLPSREEKKGIEHHANIRDKPEKI
jgi:hypothetical protein